MGIKKVRCETIN